MTLGQYICVLYSEKKKEKMCILKGLWIYMSYFLDLPSDQQEMNNIVIVFSCGNGFQVGFFFSSNKRPVPSWLAYRYQLTESNLFCALISQSTKVRFDVSSSLRKSLTIKVSCVSFSAKEFWDEGVEWIMPARVTSCPRGAQGSIGDSAGVEKRQWQLRSLGKWGVWLWWASAPSS